MNDVIQLVRGYARAMWAYHWHGLLVAWAVFLLGAGYVVLIPDEYEVEARLFIDTDSILGPLLKDLTVSADVVSEVDMVSMSMKSRPHLSDVIDNTGLAEMVESQADREEMIMELRRRILLHGDPDADLFTIKYRDSNPELAQEVVQTVLDTLMKDSIGANRTDTSDAQAFLIEQIDDYEKRLVVAERKLAEFKKEHVGEMPGTEGDYYTRLQDAEKALGDIDISLKDAKVWRDQVRRQLEGEEPIFGIVSSPEGTARKDVSTRYDRRVEEREAELNSLLLKFTENHPDVIALRDVLRQLKASQAAERRRLGSGRQPAKATSALAQNPVYQRTRMSLNQAEITVARLERQLVEQERKVHQLRQKVDTIPEVEAELARLNRDYSVTQDKYRTLLERLESAKLSEQAQNRDEISFRIIEPPVVPSESVGPNRSVFLVVVFMAAVGAGIGFTFFLSQVKPVFSDVKSLRRVTELPVLGSVSMVWTDSQKRRLRLEVLSFSLVFSLLFLVFSVAVVYYTMGTELFQSKVV